MMAAVFIVAIRGTFTQAFLLGVSAAISHSLINLGSGCTGAVFWRALERGNSGTLSAAGFCVNDLGFDLLDV